MINKAGYKIYMDGKRLTIPVTENPLLAKVDKDHDKVVSCEDVEKYLRKEEILPRLHSKRQADITAIVSDFKHNLAHKTTQQSTLYPQTYSDYVKQMEDLQAKYPKLAKMVPIGNLDNGTTVYALKISSNVAGDTSSKPAVLYTGLIHAREWATGMVTMQTAQNLLQGYGKDSAMTDRVDKAEQWFIPVINPNGYDYSRTVDSYWRKNRHIIYQDETACPPSDAKHEEVGVGVDLNRNFCDPDHVDYYRTQGDTPCSTDDDYGASDYPGDETYRGRDGASEREVQIYQDFIGSHKNLIGIVDLHSYGNMLLYPRGYTEDPVDNVQEYLDCAKAIQDAGGQNFTVMQSFNLYATTGSSEDYHQAQGILNFTFEIGTQFHPDQKELKDLLNRIPGMNLAFFDWVLAHKAVAQPSAKAA